MNEKPDHHVVAAVIVRDGFVLATERGSGNYTGWWEFPGGKIEPGEASISALVREIKEELDADILVGEFIITTRHEYPEYFVTIDFYLCELLSDFALLEHSSARWLSSENLYSVRWLPADEPVLAQLSLG